MVKCTFLALAGLAPLDAVELAEPLDLEATVAAPSQAMPDAFVPGGPACWTSKFENGVLTQERGVE